MEEFGAKPGPRASQEKGSKGQSEGLLLGTP